jgi:hypothetical protein
MEDTTKKQTITKTVRKIVLHYEDILKILKDYKIISLHELRSSDIYMHVVHDSSGSFSNGDVLSLSGTKDKGVVIEVCTKEVEGDNVPNHG